MENSSTLRTHLQDAIDRLPWDWLSDQARQGRLLVVGRSLELPEVGVALAEDNAPRVRQWIDDGIVYKPLTHQIERWDAQRDRRFEALVVYPFVLVKEPQD